MPEQSTPLSGMTGVKVDIADVREEVQGGAAFDPKSCPIQFEKIPITAVYSESTGPILCLIGWKALSLRLSSTT